MYNAVQFAQYSLLNILSDCTIIYALFLILH
jgi:hypothetical protein